MHSKWNETFNRSWTLDPIPRNPSSPLLFPIFITSNIPKFRSYIRKWRQRRRDLRAINNSGSLTPLTKGCSIGSRFPSIESEGGEGIAILRRVSTPCKHGTRSPRAPSKLARSEWQDECGWLHSRGFFSRPWQRAGIITRGAATAMVPGTLRILAIVPTFIPPCIFIARRVHEI